MVRAEKELTTGLMDSRSTIRNPNSKSGNIGPKLGVETPPKMSPTSSPTSPKAPTPGTSLISISETSEGPPQAQQGRK